LFYEIYLKSSRPPIRKSCRVVFTPAEKRYLFDEIFHGSKLDWLDFSKADLQGTRFEGASLCGCNFSGANLRGTVFWDCDLRWPRFDRCVFGDNSFRRSWLTGVAGITVSLFEYIRARGGHFAYC